MDTKALLLAAAVLGGVYLYTSGKIPGLPTAGTGGMSSGSGPHIAPPRVLINRYPCAWKEKLNDPNWKFPKATWTKGGGVLMPDGTVIT